MKRLFCIGVFFFCIAVAQAKSFNKDEVQYIWEKVGYNDDFNSEKGWGREPIAQYLKAPMEMLVPLFPEPTKELSITAEIKGQAIGCRNVNWWQQDYLEAFPVRLQHARLLYNENKQFKQYADVLEMMYQEGLELKELLLSMNIPVDLVVHNSGLMVLKDYEGNGIASRLQAESIDMLAKKGIKAIVTETTNIGSAKIMQRNGFIKFKSFSYEDDLNFFGLAGELTLWYLIL